MQASVTERLSPPRGERLPRHVRALLRLARRELPAPACEVAVERGIEVPAGDGVGLLTDHYRPLTGEPAPALLVRTPYGRGFPWDYVYGALFARQGFHVLIQSCRGTGGSGGEFEPFTQEAADARAAVAWVREQDWFTGALGTVGASYLGYTQLALAADPPPELLAMVLQVSSDDFYPVLYPGGAFALEASLTGTAGMESMHRGFGRFILAIARVLRHQRRATRTVPFIDAYPAVFGKRVGYFEQWLAHSQPGDPFWAARRVTAVPELIPPTSLLTGWWDICLDQTLALYQRLRAGGREVRLVVGPWNHTSGFSDDMPVLLGEAAGWLRARLTGDRSALPAQRAPVRVHVGELGTRTRRRTQRRGQPRNRQRGQWRDLADWPPPEATPRVWHLHGDGTLAAQAPAETAVSSFRYDPARPTPSVGGPSLDSRPTRPVRNGKLEARADVLTFTSAPLAGPAEVIGPVSIALRVRGSSPHFDVFARLCEVDVRGRSWNICDGLLRLGDQPDGGWRYVTVPMSSTAHRFAAGHRLRVLISGGAHPRFARNTGTGEPWATATRLVPVDIEIAHGGPQPCVLTLPMC